MRGFLHVLARIAGTLVGLLSGGMGLGWLAVFAFCQGRLVVAADSASFMFFFAPGFLIGATFGAAAGATVVHKILRQRISFWKAFLGGVLGLVVGSLLEVLYNVALVHNSLDARLFFTLSALVLYVPLSAGVVISSGWKAEPADAHRLYGCREDG